MSIDRFIFGLVAELTSSINTNFKDNYDYYRFGKQPTTTGKWSIKKSITSFLNKRGYFSNFNNEVFRDKIITTQFPISDFFYLYDHLEDIYSKELLLKIIAYRILGYEKVKLPLSTNEFWTNQKLVEANQSETDFIEIEQTKIKLPLTDLSFLGIPLKMYYSALGINIDFIIRQYEFNRESIHIQAEKGEFVIDAGGCYGDTALYFANKVGNNGKVFVFEFIPDNINILLRNIGLNSEYQSVIELVDRPLSHTSDQDVFYMANGPASRVSFSKFDGFTGQIKTISIDDFVHMRQLEKVDFIKMDIEGAETDALRGSIDTIIKYKPKLAIALYHSTSDFDVIPRFINELNLGYKFYLSHSTIYAEETMLFAICQK
jgi:FkbM family methyltransferase